MVKGNKIAVKMRAPECEGNVSLSQNSSEESGSGPAGGTARRKVGLPRLPQVITKSEPEDEAEERAQGKYL